MALGALPGEPLAGFTPVRVFWAVGLAAGLLLLCLTPPYQGCDEHAHLCRAYHISTGHILAQRQGTHVGATLPVSLTHARHALEDSSHFNYQYRVPRTALAHWASAPLQPDSVRFTDFRGAAIYPPLPYLPQAVLMAPARWLGAGPVVLVYVGRVAGLVVFLLLVWLGIRWLPFFHWAYIVLALAPMSLYQAATLSADSVTHGLAFLWLALTLHLAYGGDAAAQRRTVQTWVAVGVGLAVCKFAYAAMLPLAVIIPAHRLGGWRGWGADLGALVGGVLLLGGGWGLLAGGLFQAHPETPGVDPGAQLAFIFSNPGDFCLALFTSIGHQAGAIAEMWIGVLGCVDTFLPPVVYDSFDFVLLAIALAQGTPPAGPRIPVWHRAVWLGVFVGGAVAVFTFLYLAWNPVASPGIIGLHGRYFIPFAPLLFLLPSLRGGVRTFQPFLPLAGLWALALGLLAARAVWVRFW